MTSQPTHRAGVGRWSHWPVAWALIAGCAATVVVSFGLREQGRRADKARLHDEAVAQMEAFETRVELFVEMLKRLADQHSRAPSLDQEHWDALLRDLNLRAEYPGLAGVGFWQFVPSNGPPDFSESWRTMALTPPRHSGSGETYKRAFHSAPTKTSPNAFVTRTSEESFEPDEDLRAKISWTVGVGPGAMPGEAIFDHQHERKDRGFRILLPVFAPERLPRNLIQEHHKAAHWESKVDVGTLLRANEWGNLLGILYGEFAMKDFVTSTLGDRLRAVEFTIYDAPTGWSSDPKTLLTPIYGDTGSPSTHPYLEERLEMLHYGRRLVFDCHTTATFDAHSLRRWPLLAALVGGFITLLMAGLVFSQTQARLRQETDAARLRATNEQLTVALRDRERISRELHDGALQSIYSVGLGLTLCHKIVTTQPERARTLLSETMESINAVVSELRQFLLTLEADVVQGGSLESVLKTMTRRLEATTSARMTLDVDPTVAVALPSKESLHLLNVVREAVSNSCRHGEASEIRVSLRPEPPGWRLEIRDNGRGFDAERIGGKPGHGLRNMRARAAELGATFVLESRPGSGTILRIACAVKTA